MSDLSRSDLRVVYPPDIKAGVAALRHARAAYGSNEEAVARAVYHAMRNDERADLRAVLEEQLWVLDRKPGYEAAEIADSTVSYEAIADHIVDSSIRKPTAAEVLAAAATLITKERYLTDPLVARFVDQINRVFATKPASDLERLLAYVATFPGVQVFDTPRPTSGPWLKPGRYLIAPYDKEDEE